MASSLKAEDGHRRLGRSNLLPFRHKMPTRVSLVDSFLHASGANSRLRQRCARAEPRLSPRAKQPSGYEIHPLRARALRRRAKSAHIRSAWDAVAGASQHGRRPSLQHRSLEYSNETAEFLSMGDTDEAALLGALSIASTSSSTLPLSALFADAQQSFMDIGESSKSSDDPELQVISSIPLPLPDSRPTRSGC